VFKHITIKGGKIMDIIMISGACCIPSMANFDNEARKIIDEAISITGVQAKVNMITASVAFGNNAFREIIKKGMEMTGRDIRSTPVVIIDGEVISYGIPKIEDIKKALIKSS
jgi:hypothetical protein